MPTPVADDARPQGLRIADQETARVVAIHHPGGTIVGAGCLLDSQYVLTCRHVVEAAAGGKRQMGDRVYVSLAGVRGRIPTVVGSLVKLGGTGPEDDLALIELQNVARLEVPPVEFASPLRHGGKSYSVLGFPGGDPQGRNATGKLHAADAKGLVQMDRGGALTVLGGFSGAPVWSAEVNSFVGIVVTEQWRSDVSWCIPSRRLCEFYPELRVRFRIPPEDRPVIHDYDVDDPNLDLFGRITENGTRKLTAKIKEHNYKFSVDLKYECFPDPGHGNGSPRGHFVTFVTYPDFMHEEQDSYELFGEIVPLKNGKGWCAKQSLEPKYLFTVAAVGDAGDTALTLDLEKQYGKC